MKKIAIIYHSGFGHTTTQAKHALAGLNKVEDIEAKIFTTIEAIENLAEFEKFNAIIFGCPTYMGSVSAPFKDFMDKTSTIWMERKWHNKIAAAFTNSHSLSGDKLNTLIQLNIFAMQHGMIWVGQDELNNSKDYDAGNKQAVNRIGSFLGAMAQTENSVSLTEGDALTTEKLAIRVAEITKKLNF